MLSRYVLISITGIATATASSASAQTSPWKLYPTAIATTDYRYNGVSYSDGEPAAQLSLYATAPRRFYFGLWASQVDFNDPGRTSYEVDLYAGKTFRVADAEIGIEVLYTFFPDKSFPGPTYDFLQGKVRAKRAFDKLAVGGHVSWTSEASYASGTAVRIALDASYEIAPWARLSANIGRRGIEVGLDRTYWDTGITLSWRKLALDVRYVDTNLSPAICGRGCDATMVATLSANLW